MLLSNNWQCMPSLRGPAISRLQKIHNIELIFKVLTDKGVDLSTPEGNICGISCLLPLLHYFCALSEGIICP